MFDWNDQDQVGDSIWAEFSESEDHVVPYSKGTEENRLLNYADYNKKQKIEENTVLASTEQTSRSNTDYQGRHVENQPALQTNGELSAPVLELESWPDLPSLDAALGRSYCNESDQDSMAAAYLNDFNAVQNLDKVRVQLDGQPEVFGNDHEDKESDNFLDCDWGNIGDFDDLDRIFRTCYLTGINLLIVVLPRSSLMSFLVEEINQFLHQKRSVENILERYEPYTYAEKLLISANPKLQGNWCLKYNKLKVNIDAIQKSQRLGFLWEKSPTH